MRNEQKASDIPDAAIRGMIKNGHDSLFAMQEYLAGAFHAKVVHAKLAQMVYKGRLLGCACGCRGDFKIPSTPEEGRAARMRRLAAKRLMNAESTWPNDWRERLYTASSEVH